MSKKPDRIRVPIFHELSLSESSSSMYGEKTHKEAFLKQRFIEIKKPVEVIAINGVIDTKHLIDKDIRVNKLKAYDIELISVSPFIMKNWNDIPTCTLVYEAYFVE